MKRIACILIAILIPLVCSGDGWYFSSGAGGGEVADPTDQFSGNPVFSVGVTATELDNEGTISVSSNIATFSVAFPTNVGVGDVVQYDVDNDGTIGDGEYGIIHGISTDRKKAYLLKTNGGNVTNTSAATEVYDIFRAYTSLANWESSTENTNIDEDCRDDYGLTDLDLTDGDDEDGPLYVACYADGADAACVIDGYTTDADDFIEIFAPYTAAMVGTSQRHAGAWSTSYYHILGTADAVLVPKDANVRLVGLQVGMNIAKAANYGVIVPNTVTDGLVVDSCIIRGNVGAEATQGRLFYVLATAAATVTLKNSILYGTSGSANACAVVLNDADSTLNVINCTISDSTNGSAAVYNDDGTTNVINCAVFNNTDDFQTDAGTLTVTYTASDDNDVAGTGNVDISPGATEADDWTAKFGGYASGDFTLNAGENALVGAGIIQTGVTVDIINTSRGTVGNACDIGAFER